jgi:hypothetical protein
MASMSARHIFILVLMVYVCVLNILLVNSLFKNYVYAHAPKIASLPMHAPWHVGVAAPEVTKKAQSSALDALQSAALDLDSEACAHSRRVVHLALVPSTPPLATHNDLEAHRSVRLLSEVRHALRHGPPVAAHVMLFPSVYTFLGSHRAWCEVLPAQTLGRAECELALLPADATHTAVFEHALRSQPCMHHLVLLHDAAHITVNFFAHLRRARDNEVLCLAQRLPGARRCPVAAFRLPRVFLLAFATQFANTSIEDAAAVMRMDGGDAPAVRLA